MTNGIRPKRTIKILETKELIYHMGCEEDAVAALELLKHDQVPSMHKSSKDPGGTSEYTQS
jgi:hypothetical protein